MPMSSSSTVATAAANESSEWIAAKDTIIAELQTQVTALKKRIEWFERQLFGQKSERIV